MTATRIIKIEEKHVTYHYDISTEEQYSKVALDVLRRRDQEGYWYYPPEESKSYVSDSSKEMAAIPDEITAQLPKKMQEEIKEAKNAIRSAASRDKQYQAWWDLLRETLALSDEDALAKKRFWTIKLSSGDVEKSRPMVQVLFESRQGYQYEQYKIIELDTLD